MSCSRKKPVGQTRSYRMNIACCGEQRTEEWKRDYNRSMRRKNHQHETILNKILVEDIADHEEDFLNKPALTNEGNEWNSPGDGTQLIREDHSWWAKRPYQFGMK